MAYVDQNGLIMIDEVEASVDIKKLKIAMEALSDALAVINNMASINSTFKGEAANSIDFTVNELIKKIDIQKIAIENEIKIINQTIEKYKIIDSNVKNQINSALT